MFSFASRPFHVRSDFRFSSAPLVKLERDAEASSPNRIRFRARSEDVMKNDELRKQNKTLDDGCKELRKLCKDNGIAVPEHLSSPRFGASGRSPPMPQSARPGYNMARPVTSPSTSPAMVRAAMGRAKNDDGVSESARVMRYLKMQQEEAEHKGALVLTSPSKRSIDPKKAKLRHDQIDSRHTGLQSTGLMHEIHTVFTLGTSWLRHRSGHVPRPFPRTLHPLCCMPRAWQSICALACGRAFNTQEGP